MPQARRKWNRAPRGLAGALVACVGLLPCAGCEIVEPATFPAGGPPIVWPKPPDSPRIRYIGELSGEASLGRHIRGAAALRAIIAGVPAAARFATPTSVAVSGSRIYVADPAHGSGALIHVLDLQSHQYDQIRAAGTAPLRWPIDVAAGGGGLAVADATGGVVYVLDGPGASATTIGRGAIQRPASVALGADRSLWVLDAAAHQVLHFAAGGELLQRIGRRGSEPGEFNYPAGLACAAAGDLFGVAVADSMNFRVQLLRNDGSVLRTFGRKGDAAGDFSLPRDAAVDSDGHVYVLDNQFENVQIFDVDGQLLMAFGEEGNGPGQFNLPSGITIDSQDRIWVADTYNRRVQAFQYLAEGRP